MENTFLIITSIAHQNHPILKKYAVESARHQVPFIIVGDTKSPNEFNITNCDYYSIGRQRTLPFELARLLPHKHYARKNLGYLIGMTKGAEIIIETDDDNEPLEEFWNKRVEEVNTHVLIDKGWVNIYKYFTESHVWPRGFSLEHITNELPLLERQRKVKCPIQQGLADENPDVDAVYRLTLPLPIRFNKACNIALGKNSLCPFNSQNTTWFKKAFPLMYLPSHCNFRMTDIWRSFIAQRIAWTCGWTTLFHNSTVKQIRNDHDLMEDFKSELPGYTNNALIYDSLMELTLKEGEENIPYNMGACYQKMIELGLVGQEETLLLDSWLKDIEFLIKE